jgi:hypothetical protein
LPARESGHPTRPARILFAPVRIVEKRLAPRLSRRLFASVWALIDRENPPPRAEDPQESVVKLALALALDGACAAIVTGLMDQAARRRFARLTGRWPGRGQRS